MYQRVLEGESYYDEKRFLGLFLAFCVVFTSIPANASAALADFANNIFTNGYNFYSKWK